MPEYQIYILIEGVLTYLSEGTPLQVLDIANLGASKATRITERSPAQDGDSDIDRVLEARIIPMVLQAIPDQPHGYSYAAIRRLLNTLFKGTNASMSLGIIFEDSTHYRIDVKSIGDLNLPLNIENQAVLKVPITLRAANPTFYDPLIQPINFGLTGAGATLVPTVIPMLVGGSTVDQTVSFAYQGTYRSFPVITITGPITNPVITNITTGLKLDFTGFTINAGNYYTIDLRFGRKLIYRNGVLSDNRLSELTTDSDIAEFAIEASPEVPGGVNTFTVTGTASTNATSIVIQFFNRYDGI